MNAFGSSSRVRVVYGDGSSEFHSALESVDSIPDSILGTYYLPQLLSRAIGSTAALYELFWMEATGEPPRRKRRGDLAFISLSVCPHFVTCPARVFAA